MNVRLAPEHGDALRRAIRERAGLGAPQAFEGEDLVLKPSAEDPATGGELLSFDYVFDEDYASQYDKTLVFAGTARCTADGHVELVTLALVHLGVAARYSPPQSLGAD